MRPLMKATWISDVDVDVQAKPEVEGTRRRRRHTSFVYTVVEG